MWNQSICSCDCIRVFTFIVETPRLKIIKNRNNLDGNGEKE